MKKLLSYIFILTGLALLATATSRPLMGKIWKQKHNGQWWAEHLSNFGDLTNMSFLDDIKYFQTPKDYVFKRPADTTAPHNIDLYLFGDSYTEDVPDSVFNHLHSYHYAYCTYSDLLYKLDSTKRNVLVIEKTERHVRTDFKPADIYTHIRRDNDHTSLVYNDEIAERRTYAGLFNFKFNFEDINPKVNQSLDYLLFNMNIFNRPHCLKADMNYYLFNRASGDVVISKDGTHLFLRQSVEPNLLFSSYMPFSDKDADEVVANFAEIYQHYIKEGFDEVYLAIIPSPASLIQPEPYNQMLPTIYNHPGFKMPNIDLYSRYKQLGNPKQFYRAGDTHWNNAGAQVWLGMVNEILAQESKKGPLN